MNHFKVVIYKQITQLTSFFVSNNIAVSFNFPVINWNDIIWDWFKDISYTLKKESYDLIYSESQKNSAYNFMLKDWWLIQLLYRFNKKDITWHRLAYYPNPNFEQFSQYPEDFDEKHYSEILFSEMIYKNNLIIPVRFDYDIDENKFKEYYHSYSHCSIGWYKNCRITVSWPISPNKFIEFILKNFYHEIFLEIEKEYNFWCKLNFNNTITESEKNIIYFWLH